MFFLSMNLINIHIFILNSYLDHIIQQHASHVNHACLIKINRSVLIEILRIEFLDDMQYCKIIKLNAKDENIFDVFQISIDVQSIILEIIKFDKEMSDEENDERIVAIIQNIVFYNEFFLYDLEENARKMSDSLKLL